MDCSYEEAHVREGGCVVAMKRAAVSLASHGWASVAARPLVDRL